jgi:hypothetical protein
VFLIIELTIHLDHHRFFIAMIRISDGHRDFVRQDTTCCDCRELTIHADRLQEIL